MNIVLRGVTLWIYLDVFKWNEDCAAKLTQRFLNK